MATIRSEYIFVYGTLMKKYPLNAHLQLFEMHARYISDAFTTGNLFLIDYYPGLVETDTFESVHGEIFEILDAEKLFASLDHYEDYYSTDESRSLFIRKQIQVYFSVHKEPVTAWTYVFNKPTALFRHIESGNFMEFISENEDK